jgi:hypothetical protein
MGVIMSDRVRDLIASFDALPEPDRREAVVEILRRVPRSGSDLSAAALDELADELFAALDDEEAARAGR